MSAGGRKRVAGPAGPLPACLGDSCHARTYRRHEGRGLGGGLPGRGGYFAA